jgi:DNA-binding transcriptional ArsR family regulator
MLPIDTMNENAEQAEALLKILANKARLMVLCQLVSGEKSVSEIQENIDLSQSALSQHLAKLRQQDIVSTRRDGTQIYYSLSSIEVQAIMSTLYLIYCKD